MLTIQGDPAAIVAAALTQAEMTLRASAEGAKSQMLRRYGSARSTVQAAYEHYLTLVTTGIAPEGDQGG